MDRTEMTRETARETDWLSGVDVCASLHVMRREGTRCDLDATHLMLC